MHLPQAKPASGARPAPGASGPSALRRLVGQRETSVALLLLVVVVFMTFANENFLTSRNLLAATS